MVKNETYKKALIETLDAFNVPKCYYAIDDVMADSVCLIQTPDGWKVLTVERNAIMTDMLYKTPEEACKRMLFLLSNDGKGTKMNKFFMKALSRAE